MKQAQERNNETKTSADKSSVCTPVFVNVTRLPESILNKVKSKEEKRLIGKRARWKEGFGKNLEQTQNDSSKNDNNESSSKKSSKYTLTNTEDFGCSRFIPCDVTKENVDVSCSNLLSQNERLQDTSVKSNQNAKPSDDSETKLCHNIKSDNCSRTTPFRSKNEDMKTVQITDSKLNDDNRLDTNERERKEEKIAEEKEEKIERKKEEKNETRQEEKTEKKKEEKEEEKEKEEDTDTKICQRVLVYEHKWKNKKENDETKVVCVEETQSSLCINQEVPESKSNLKRKLSFTSKETSPKKTKKAIDNETPFSSETTTKVLNNEEPIPFVDKKCIVLVDKLEDSSDPLVVQWRLQKIFEKTQREKTIETYLINQIAQPQNIKEEKLYHPVLESPVPSDFIQYDENDDMNDSSPRLVINEDQIINFNHNDGNETPIVETIDDSIANNIMPVQEDATHLLQEKIPDKKNVEDNNTESLGNILSTFSTETIENNKSQNATLVNLENVSGKLENLSNDDMKQLVEKCVQENSKPDTFLSTLLDSKTQNDTTNNNTSTSDDPIILYQSTPLSGQVENDAVIANDMVSSDLEYLVENRGPEYDSDIVPIKNNDSSVSKEAELIDLCDDSTSTSTNEDNSKTVATPSCTSTSKTTKLKKLDSDIESKPRKESYKCVFCKMECKVLSKLKLHLERKHPKYYEDKELMKQHGYEFDVSMECNVCKFKFDTKENLFDHIIKHTESELQEAFKMNVEAQKKKQLEDLQKSSLEGKSIELVSFKDNVDSDEQSETKDSTDNEKTSEEKSKENDVQAITVDKKRRKSDSEKPTKLKKIKISKQLENLNIDATKPSNKVYDTDILSENNITENKDKSLSKESSESVMKLAPPVEIANPPVPATICACHAEETSNIIQKELSIEIVFLCKTCNIVFRSQECMELHYRSNVACSINRLINKVPKILCSECRCLINTFPLLRKHCDEHIQKHAKRKIMYLCNCCKVIFYGSWSFFYTHWYNHNKDTSFVGSRYSFPKWSIIPANRTDISIEMQNLRHDYLCVAEIVCKKCSTPFQDRADLEKHSESHIPCGSNVSNNTQMSIFCNICKETFSTKQCFDEHTVEKNHVPSTPPIHIIVSVTPMHRVYCCSVCRVINQTEIQLKSHWQKHNPVKEYYSCQICNNCTQVSFNNICAHFERYHKNCPISCSVNFIESIFICKICNLGFDDNETLTEHNTIHKATTPSAEKSSNNVANPSMPNSIKVMANMIERNPIKKIASLTMYNNSPTKAGITYANVNRTNDLNQKDKDLKGTTTVQNNNQGNKLGVYIVSSKTSDPIVACNQSNTPVSTQVVISGSSGAIVTTNVTPTFEDSENNIVWNKKQLEMSDRPSGTPVDDGLIEQLVAEANEKSQTVNTEEDELTDWVQHYITKNILNSTKKTDKILRSENTESERLQIKSQVKNIQQQTTAITNQPAAETLQQETKTEEQVVIKRKRGRPKDSKNKVKKGNVTKERPRRSGDHYVRNYSETDAHLNSSLLDSSISDTLDTTNKDDLLIEQSKVTPSTNLPSASSFEVVLVPDDEEPPSNSFSDLSKDYTKFNIVKSQDNFASNDTSVVKTDAQVTSKVTPSEETPQKKSFIRVKNLSELQARFDEADKLWDSRHSITQRNENTPFEFSNNSSSNNVQQYTQNISARMPVNTYPGIRQHIPNINIPMERSRHPLVRIVPKNVSHLPPNYSLRQPINTPVFSSPYNPQIMGHTMMRLPPEYPGGSGLPSTSTNAQLINVPQHNFAMQTPRFVRMAPPNASTSNAVYNQPVFTLVNPTQPVQVQDSSNAYSCSKCRNFSTLSLNEMHKHMVWQCIYKPTPPPASQPPPPPPPPPPPAPPPLPSLPSYSEIRKEQPHLYECMYCNQYKTNDNVFLQIHRKECAAKKQMDANERYQQQNKTNGFNLQPRDFTQLCHFVCKFCPMPVIFTSNENLVSHIRQCHSTTGL